jgi:hypothetical protein
MSEGFFENSNLRRVERNLLLTARVTICTRATLPSSPAAHPALWRTPKEHQDGRLGPRPRCSPEATQRRSTRPRDRWPTETSRGGRGARSLLRVGWLGCGCGSLCSLFALYWLRFVCGGPVDREKLEVACWQELGRVGDGCERWDRVQFEHGFFVRRLTWATAEHDGLDHPQGPHHGGQVA